MIIKGVRRSRRYVTGRRHFSSLICSNVIRGDLCDVEQLGFEEGGLSEISENKYSPKSVDIYIYVYMYYMVHNKWHQSRGIFQPY